MKLHIPWSSQHVTCLFLLCFLLSTKTAARKKAKERDLSDNESVDEMDNNTLDKEIPRRVDPKGSWFAFVRHAKKDNNRRRASKPKNKNKNKNKRNGKGKCKTKSLRGLHGPPGPQGPPGDEGPPGALITEEALMKEFKEMVKEASERRAAQLVSGKCPVCPEPLNNTTYMLPLHEIDELNIVPRVTTAYHVRLRGRTTVSRRTFMELKNFHIPFGAGAFQRGDVFNSRLGRFTAPRVGIYQFSTTLHIQHNRKKKRRRKHRRTRRYNKRENVKAMICIDSLCQKYTSLQFISGLESKSKIFTISVAGLLHLQTGQYVSVYLDNASGNTVFVHSGSEFTGLLIGI